MNVFTLFPANTLTTIVFLHDLILFPTDIKITITLPQDMFLQNNVTFLYAFSQWQLPLKCKSSQMIYRESIKEKIGFVMKLDFIG